MDDHQTGTGTGEAAFWHCPSRWLMAHHDARAGLNTFSSHLCLADLNGDGENLLALVDFKTRANLEEASAQDEARQPVGPCQSPYDVRLRVYRGQQLIYNHFIGELPACLLVTSIRSLAPSSELAHSGERHHLTMACMDDVYFYHRLKPTHRFSLEDDPAITSSLNKSELDAWQMARAKKSAVDTETLRELLVSLRDELGADQLSSHSSNYLALESQEERRNYLSLWRLKRLGGESGAGEPQIMSMDTICCGAARLSFASTVTRSGDFGQTREPCGPALLGRAGGGSNWYATIVDIQRDGLVLGTEDRHLLVYELRLGRARLESHHRLASVPDHVLVERRSPLSIRPGTPLKSLTYKVLVSCRNCRIYSLDLPYLPSTGEPAKPEPRELLLLKCNVLDMCWAVGADGAHESQRRGPESQQDLWAAHFVVACLNRQVHCFSSLDGQCKWTLDFELPVTALVSLPLEATAVGASAGLPEGLVGVATQASRVDFYVASSGRIVDSIYLRNDNCQAMTFGRFGREDNCLCMVTRLGHLLIFILKRTAKFGHGQCLSSAASHAADALANFHRCSQAVGPEPQRPMQQQQQQQHQRAQQNEGQPLGRLAEPAGVPAAFALAKSTLAGKDSKAARAAEARQAEHSCEQEAANKSYLDARLKGQPLKVPIKSKDFVDQIVQQSRHSPAISREFARHMAMLRNKIASATAAKQQDSSGRDEASGNRVALAKVVGLGNTYRVSLSLRVNLEPALVRRAREHLSSGKSGAPMELSMLLFQQPSSGCQLKPFSFHFELPAARPAADRSSSWLLEKTIEFRLTLREQPQAGPAELAASISLELYVLLGPADRRPGRARRPVFISSVNIPTNGAG